VAHCDKLKRFPPPLIRYVFYWVRRLAVGRLHVIHATFVRRSMSQLVAAAAAAAAGKRLYIASNGFLSVTVISRRRAAVNIATYQREHLSHSIHHARVILSSHLQAAAYSTMP